MRRFFQNFGALTGARAVQAISQFVALPFFARVLSLEDFALIALAMTVVNFTTVLSDAGLNRSLIRQREYCRDEWSSVFWMLGALGVALAVVVLGAAHAIAWAMALPALVAVMSALAGIPLMLALTAPPSAALEREDRFGVLAAVSVAASLGSLALAIWLAAAGAGVWALVAQQIAMPLITLAGTFAMSPFRPRAVFSRAALGQHVRFGRDTVLVSFVFTLQRQAPVLMIQRVLGSVPLGLYAMNERLMRLPRFGLAGPFGQVMYIRMVAARDDPARLGRLLTAGLWLMAVVVVPGMVVLSAVAEPVFAVIFSEKWRGVGTIFALTSVGVMLEVVTSSVGGLFNATGRTDLRVRMALERAVFALALFALALPYGIEAAAGSQSLFMVLYLRRLWHWAERCAEIDIADALRAVTTPFLISLPLAGALFLAERWLTFSDATLLALGGVVGLAATALTAALCRRALTRALHEIRG